MMQSDPERADGLLKLSDSELLAFDERQASDLKLRALEVDFLGIRLRGPARVDTGTQAELRLLLLSKTTGLRSWQVNADRNAVLVGVDGATGAVRSGWAHPTHKRLNVDMLPRSRAVDEAPGPEDAESLMVTAEILAARQILQPTWSDGELDLTLISYDWVSNTVRVQLRSGSSPAAGVAPFPAQRVRALIEAMGEPQVWAHRREGTPTLTGPGAALAVPGVARADVESFIVQGALRMPVPAGCIVEPSATGAAEHVTAVLRASLLVVRLDEMYPARIDLEIPVVTGDLLSPGEDVEGCFAIDLRVAPVWPVLLGGDALVYLVAGQHLAGPYAVAVER